MSKFQLRDSANKAAVAGMPFSTAGSQRASLERLLREGEGNFMLSIICLLRPSTEQGIQLQWFVSSVLPSVVWSAL